MKYHTILFLLISSVQCLFRDVFREGALWMGRTILMETIQKNAIEYKIEKLKKEGKPYSSFEENPDERFKAMIRPIKPKQDGEIYLRSVWLLIFPLILMIGGYYMVSYTFGGFMDASWTNYFIGSVLRIFSIPLLAAIYIEYFVFPVTAEQNMEFEYQKAYKIIMKSD